MSWKKGVGLPRKTKSICSLLLLLLLYRLLCGFSVASFSPLSSFYFSFCHFFLSDYASMCLFCHSCLFYHFSFSFCLFCLSFYMSLLRNSVSSFTSVTSPDPSICLFVSLLYLLSLLSLLLISLYVSSDTKKYLLSLLLLLFIFLCVHLSLLSPLLILLVMVSSVTFSCSITSAFPFIWLLCHFCLSISLLIILYISLFCLFYH